MSKWAEELESLGRLRDKGLITDEEFEEQKRGLLPRSPYSSPQADGGNRSISDSGFSAGEQFLTLLIPLLIAGAAIASLVVAQFAVPGEDPKLSDIDEGVVLVVAFFVIPCVFLFGLAISRARVRPWVYAAVPTALLAAWTLAGFAIISLRVDVWFDEYNMPRDFTFIGVVREGFWLLGGAALVFLLFGLWLISLVSVGSRRLSGSPSEWSLIVGTLLFIAGMMYPTLQPMQRISWEDRIRDPEFTAYVSIFQDLDWEFFVAEWIVSPVVLLFCLLVVLLAPTDRSYLAGLCGFLYVTFAYVAYWVAGNAEGEQEFAWSTGGWIALLGTAVILLAVASEYSRQAPQRVRSG